MLGGVTAVSDLITPSVLITSGAIVLNSLSASYVEVGEQIHAGRKLRRKHQILHQALAAVLVGLVLLVASTVTITIAVTANSHALDYASVTLVILGAVGLLVGMIRARSALGLHDDPE